MSEPRRVGVFGWGIVAPRSPDVEAFARNLESPASWLAPFDGFGPEQLPRRHARLRLRGLQAAGSTPASRRAASAQLDEKMDAPTHYAIGAFIQALGQNPGIEEELRGLGSQAHVYVGTGIGDVATIGRETRRLDRAQRRWDRFWSAPERNPALRAWQALSPADRADRRGRRAA